MTVLDKSHRSNAIASHEQKITLLSHHSWIGWRKHAYGMLSQFFNSRCDRAHMAMEATGYGGFKHKNSFTAATPHLKSKQH
jgi:hypothetical protein